MVPVRFAWLLAAVVATIAGTVEAAGPTRMALPYDVTWNGLGVAQVEFELALAEASYRVDYRARSSGFLGWLRPFASEGMSAGRYEGTSAVPSQFAASSRGERTAEWSVEFDPSGRAVRVDVPPQDATEREPVDAAFRIAPDPLALALTALAQAGPDQRRTARSFDGRRALELQLACAGMVDVHGLLACEIEGRVVAGGRRAAADDLPPAPPPPVRVWLGRQTGVAGWWPVRAEVETRWGPVTARLARVGPGGEGALATDGAAPH